MLIFFYITLTLLLAYGGMIDFYRRSWNQIPQFSIDKLQHHPFNSNVSIIIAARNEERSIKSCINSLLTQTYPANLVEIIVVNDHSSDRTADIVNSFSGNGVQLINLEDFIKPGPINSFKKKSIELGISRSTGEWILCTDADCVLPPQWIESMVWQFENEKSVFIAAPVKILGNGSVLSIFQSLDFACLQGITGAVVFKKLHCMCNGANLGYERKIFGQIGGFIGIDQQASGDDMLLMQKFFDHYPDRISFLKSPGAIVTTEATVSWSGFFSQRIRWASKARRYKDKALSWNLFFVFTLNLLLGIFTIACCWNPIWFLGLLFFLVLKTILEFPFVKTLAAFFGLTDRLKYFFLLQPLHVFYTIIAGLLGNFPGYEWKGRKVR
jgi:cellulose synthase/poly-beta-1,6-N-acetylglucosamine synthase-like glycosyltransferase